MRAASATIALPDTSSDTAPPKAPPRHWAWARLMRRAFDIDGLACPRCGGRLRLIATVEDPGAIRAILAGLGPGLAALAGGSAACFPTVRTQRA